MLVRGEGLVDSMSRYLIARIESSANITLRTHTQVEEVAGSVTHLEDDQLAPLRHARGREPTHPPPIPDDGATPNAAWLNDCLALDDKGFVKTGVDLVAGGARGRAVAAAPSALSARDEHARDLRRRRCPFGQREARRVGGRRGLGRRPVRAPCAARAFGPVAASDGVSLLGRLVTRHSPLTLTLSREGEGTLPQRLQKFFRFDQIGAAEALGKAAVHRAQQLPRLTACALCAP